MEARPSAGRGGTLSEHGEQVTNQEPTAAPIHRFAVVVPFFNEEEVIAEFHRRLAAVMNGLGSWMVLYVDDGGTDGGLAILRALRETDPHIALLTLSRNFGKEVATSAGIDTVRAEAVIIIDADLQDPPEIIPELVAKWEQGYEMVYAQRARREGESWVKRATASMFYRLMQDVGRVGLPRDVGDFRLMSGRVAAELSRLREHHRFMKGLFAWVGYRSCAVVYDRAARHAGTSKWNYWKLWNLAIEGISSFTVMPLKIATYLGLIVSVIAVIYAAQLIFRTLVFGNPVAGYPSLMVVVLMTLGVIGEYLGRVFNEAKQRPLYHVDELLPAAAPASAGTVTPGQHQPERAA